MIVLATTLIFFTLKKIPSASESEKNVINAIQQQKKNTNIDLLDAYIAIEKARLSVEYNSDVMKYFPYFFGVLTLMLLTIILDLEKTLNKYFTHYAFVWGEYQEEFNKAQKRKKLIFSIIIITIILGIIINVLSNFIWSQIAK